MSEEKDINVIKDLKIVEWLKCELLSAVAQLFEFLTIGDNSNREEVLDMMSNIVLLSYLLGKRLGFSYETIESKVNDHIKLSLANDHTIEKWYGDLGELQKYLNIKFRQE